MTHVEFQGIFVDKEIDKVISLLTSEQFKNSICPSLDLIDNGQMDTCFLTVFHDREYGYHLYGAGKGDRDYSVMTEEKKDDFIVARVSIN
jgi:hypothetical protein